MAIQEITGGLWIPDPTRSAGSGITFVSFLIDAAIEKFALIFQAPKSGTLDRPEFQLGTVAQAPVNGLKVSWQDVSAVNGDPDGTADQFRVVTSGISTGAWLVPGSLTSDGTDSGLRRNVTRGEVLAAVVEFSSFSGGDSVNLNALQGGGDARHQRPYIDHFTAAWAKQAGGEAVMALRYVDGTYPFVGGMTALSLATTNTYGSGTATNERALYFRFPFSVRVGGAWIRVAPTNANSDFLVILYDTDGSTVLAQTTVEGAQLMTTAGRTMFLLFPSDVTLLANTPYRLSVKPTSANTIGTYDFTVNSASIMDAFEGGQSFYASNKTSGVWGETTTVRPFFGLLVNGIDNAAPSAAATPSSVGVPDLPIHTSKGVSLAGAVSRLRARLGED